MSQNLGGIAELEDELPPGSSILGIKPFKGSKQCSTDTLREGGFRKLLRCNMPHDSYLNSATPSGKVNRDCKF